MLGGHMWFSRIRIRTFWNHTGQKKIRQNNCRLYPSIVATLIIQKLHPLYYRSCSPDATVVASWLLPKLQPYCLSRCSLTASVVSTHLQYFNSVVAAWHRTRKLSPTVVAALCLHYGSYSISTTLLQRFYSCSCSSSASVLSCSPTANIESRSHLTSCIQ